MRTKEGDREIAHTAIKNELRALLLAYIPREQCCYSTMKESIAARKTNNAAPHFFQQQNIEIVKGVYTGNEGPMLRTTTVIDN